MFPDRDRHRCVFTVILHSTMSQRIDDGRIDIGVDRLLAHTTGVPCARMWEHAVAQAGMLTCLVASVIGFGWWGLLSILFLPILFALAKRDIERRHAMRFRTWMLQSTERCHAAWNDKVITIRDRRTGKIHHPHDTEDVHMLFAKT